MRRQVAIAPLLALLASFAADTAYAARSSEQEIVVQASAVLQQIMAVPASGIPKSLLSNAQAVAIIPGVKGGAFVVGIRRGHGVIVSRDATGAWRTPQFVDLTGGSLGWQAGIQSTDVILVFQSRESLAQLMGGKLTIGADASVAAGPVGRQAAAATDITLQSEIYSYSRSRGAFLGVSIDGSMMAPNPEADARFYQPAAIAGQPGGLPASAMQLVTQVSQYADGPSSTAVPAPTPTHAFDAAPVPPPTYDPQRQLAQNWQALSAMLDPTWQQYLALNSLAGYPDAVASDLQRYQQVAATPQYASLTQRPEFQQVMATLQQMDANRQAQSSAQLQLPPPPAASGG